MTSSYASDPHEERWSRMIMSNKHPDSRYSSVSEKVNEYLSLAREQLNTGGAYYPPAFKDFVRQNQQFKDYNEKLVRDYDDLQNNRLANRATRFPISNESVLNNYILNPEQISPALKAAEGRIKALEEEMDLREKDVLRLSGIVELLIDENKYLRDHISLKNKDIAKILETTGVNDGESIHDLRHRILLLSEENNLLLNHLEELRAVRDNFDGFVEEKGAELERERGNYEACRQSLEQALVREEQLSHYRQVTEPKLRNLHDKVQELEMVNQDLMDELHQLKNQATIYANQVQTYKKNAEEAEAKRSLEVDKLIQEVNSLHNERKELKKLLDNKERYTEHTNDETRKLKKELDVNRLEYEEILQTLSDMKNQLSNERQNAELAYRREKDTKERNDKLATELEKCQIRLQNIEGQHSRSTEILKNDYQMRITKLEQIIENLKMRKNESAHEKDDEINSLNQQLLDLKKLLNKTRAERDDYHRRLNDQTHNEEDVNQRDRMIADLQDHIAKLNKEVLELHDAKRDLERRLNRQLSDLKKENNDLNELNKKLMDQAAKQPGDPGKQNEMEILRERITELTAENHLLKAQIDSLNHLASGAHKSAELERENNMLQQILKSREAVTHPTISADLSKDLTYSPNKYSFDQIYHDLSFKSQVARPLPTSFIKELSDYKPANTSVTSADVDRVINNILHKYNLERVPDTSMDVIQRDALLSGHKDIPSVYQGLSTLPNDQNRLRSPNIHFLSPLLSSAKFDSKNASLLGSGTIGLEEIRPLPFTTPDKLERPSWTAHFKSGIKEESREHHGDL